MLPVAPMHRGMDARGHPSIVGGGKSGVPVWLEVMLPAMLAWQVEMEERGWKACRLHAHTTVLWGRL
eukprot:6147587-Prorocentrum_lima.AAC.1